jgi:hypothetical protein
MEVICVLKGGERNLLVNLYHGPQENYCQSYQTGTMAISADVRIKL